MQRVYNFSAGPATLPLEVLERVQRELVCYEDWGMSVLEISHRDPRYVEILDETTSRIARLLGVSDDFEILFLQGGSRLQFTMIPMNLLTAGPAQYVLTGTWGKNALAEAKKIGAVEVAWDGESDGYSRLPAAGEWTAADGASYVHITSNETIQGVQFAEFPEMGDVPVVCDASSDFLSRPMPMSRLGLVYACAQKNSGPAGVTLVVIRKELLKRCRDDLPGYLNYANHAKADSLWNTPCTFGIYVVGLVARWLEEEMGGLAAVDRVNREKAAMLYEIIDSSGGFYRGHARADCRSLMNVTFRLDSPEREASFLAGAQERGMVALKGHRSVGGIRASIYNAMPRAGVERLAEWMEEFRRRS